MRTGYGGAMQAAAEESDGPAISGGPCAPMKWWVPAASAAALSVLLIAVVVLLVRPPGPLDDPRPAFQRDGLLRDGPVLDADVAGVRFGERTVIVLFEREEPEGRTWDQWSADVTSGGAALVVVTPVQVAHGSLVDAIGMPAPVDGGPPIGYAVVDSSRQVRYATIDPQYLKNAFEVDVISGAVE